MAKSERAAGELLTIEEAAAYIGMSVWFLRESRLSGGPRGNRTAGPRATKVGRALRYRRPDLDRWMREIRGCDDRADLRVVEEFAETFERNGRSDRRDHALRREVLANLLRFGEERDLRLRDLAGEDLRMFVGLELYRLRGSSRAAKLVVDTMHRLFADLQWRGLRDDNPAAHIEAAAPKANERNDATVARGAAHVGAC